MIHYIFSTYIYNQVSNDIRYERSKNYGMRTNLVFPSIHTGSISNITEKRNNRLQFREKFADH